MSEPSTTVKIPTRADFKPKGPFAMFRGGTKPNPGWDVDKKDLTLEQAVDEFVKYGLNPMQGCAAAVIDSYGVVLLGYEWPMFGDIAWVACDVAFNCLADHFLMDEYPLKLADIEASAAVTLRRAQESSKA